MPSLLRRVLARPLLWWGIALVWLVRDVAGNLEPAGRPDAYSVLQAGGRWLNDPAAIYADTARHLAQTGLAPVTGLLRPPVAAMLAAPFTFLPASWQIPAWTVADALAALVGLLLLQRLVATTTLERGVFWAVVFYFPPLYAEVNAGQIGGFVLLPACAAIVVARSRPLLSGALTATAAAVKLYPALMVLGARLQWRPFIYGALAAGGLLTVIACIPLGPGGTWSYVTGVLLPSLHARSPDCAATSVATLFSRSIGGEAYPIISPDGSVTMLQSPLHLPLVASILTGIVLVAALVGAVVAARASGWNPAYGLALGLALGGILPGELNPYQYLPVLPLVVMVVAVAMRRRKTALLAVIALGLVMWLRQPCLLPFPNVWTLGGLILFATCAAAAKEFRQAEF